MSRPALALIPKAEAAPASPPAPRADLPPGLAAELGGIADLIKGLHRRVTGDVIEIGRLLNIVKAKLDHGQFGAFLSETLRIEPRTAQNYMRAASFAEGKGETVSLLPPSTIYLLASPSTPAEVSTEVMACLEQGKAMHPDLIHQMVRQARNIAEPQRRRRDARANRRRRMQPAAVKRREREEERRRVEAQARREAGAKALAECLNVLLAPLSREDKVRLAALLNVQTVGWSLFEELRRRVQAEGAGA